eukprot:4634484-Heterocapsa_arctica.AAC.1
MNKHFDILRINYIIIMLPTLRDIAILALLSTVQELVPWLSLSLSMSPLPASSLRIAAATELRAHTFYVPDSGGEFLRMSGERAAT